MDTPGDGFWQEDELKKPDSSEWIRKSVNRVSFPYFPKYPKHRKSSAQKPTVHKSTQSRSTGGGDKLLQDLECFNCPICLDILVEATAPPCGHLFCAQCLSKWASKRNWCPICQNSISDLSHIFAVDCFIESHLNLLPLHTRKLIRDGRIRRLAKYECEKNSCWRRFKSELRIARIYISSKGLWRGLFIQPFVRCWRNVPFFLNFNLGGILKIFVLLMIGCFICGGPCAFTLPNKILNFLVYLINCIRVYPWWCDEDVIPLKINYSGNR